MRFSFVAWSHLIGQSNPANDPYCWMLQSVLAKLRRELQATKEGRYHVDRVDRDVRRKATLMARFATVYWLRRQKVKYDDVFAVAAEAFGIGEGTVRNSYKEHKKKLAPARKASVPLFEKMNPSDLPYGPDHDALARALAAYRAEKTPVNGVKKTSLSIPPQLIVSFPR